MKRVLRLAATVFAVFALLIGGRLLFPSASYSSARTTDSVYEMIERASMVIVAEPTGNVSYMSADGHVTFRLSEVRIEELLIGGGNEKTITILQTDEFDADVSLQAGQKYVMIVEPYIPGIKKAAGTYVISGAYKGLYPIIENGKISEFSISESGEAETVSGNRSLELKKILDNRR